MGDGLKSLNKAAAKHEVFGKLAEHYKMLDSKLSPEDRTTHEARVMQSLHDEELRPEHKAVYAEMLKTFEAPRRKPE